MTESLTAYDRIHVRERMDGKFMWEYLAAGNNATLATDGNQGYDNEDDALAGALRVCGVPIAVGENDYAYVLAGQPRVLAEKPRQLSDGSWLYPVRLPQEDA